MWRDGLLTACGVVRWYKEERWKEQAEEVLQQENARKARGNFLLAGYAAFSIVPLALATALLVHRKKQNA